jgi:hypothetical protein
LADPKAKTCTTVSFVNGAIGLLVGFENILVAFRRNANPSVDKLDREIA